MVVYFQFSTSQLGIYPNGSSVLCSRGFVRLVYQRVQRFQYFVCTGQYYFVFQYVHDMVIPLYLSMICAIMSSESDDRLRGLA